MYLLLFNIFFVAIFLSFIVGYIGLSVLAYYIGTRLRQPPKQWKEYLEQARLAGATLPSFATKSGPIRRQLVLSCPDVNIFTNLLPMSFAKVKKTASSASKLKQRTIFGYFHPNADAGGGGERVLWASVKQTLKNKESNVCAIYTATNPKVMPGEILTKVQLRFNIELDETRIIFIYLTQGRLIEPGTWPIFTILGQALGSIVLAYEAMANLVPDVFIDTQGSPFVYPLINWTLNIPIMAYVHYPVVSSDMLNELKLSKNSLLKRCFKQVYWRLMMLFYSWCGSYASVVATNSTWTQNHMVKQWSWNKEATKRFCVVYPPCAVEHVEFDPDVTRAKSIVYIAQFRPEKRHELLLREFAAYLQSLGDKADKKDLPHLILIGSVRDDDDKRRVYGLRLLTRELKLTDDNITFVLDAPWEGLKKILATSYLGVNAMWNEHFGMVLVEYMAAGLIPIAHASAGPLLDIVGDDGPGVLFKDKSDPDYTTQDGDKWPTMQEAFSKAFQLDEKTTREYRQRAHDKAMTFSDEAFAENWDKVVESLIKLNFIRSRKRKAAGSFD